MPETKRSAECGAPSFAVVGGAIATGEPGFVLVLANESRLANFTPRKCNADQHPVTGVELKARINVLVFKVVNVTLDWQESVRFTDASGQSV